MNSGPQRQFARNLQTRDAWDRFAPHRSRVTDLLQNAVAANRAATTPQKLCVLGAGNCNDLDLAALAGTFAEIHLADLDDSAMAAGVARQRLAKPPRIVHYGDVDLLNANAPPTRDCDVAASICVLSQLLEQATQACEFPAEDPRFVELVAHTRLAHLQQLLAATKPGGTALLVTDFVSSDTCPDLKTCSTEQLPQILSTAFQFRNFFTGLHPGVIAKTLQTDPALSPTVEDVTVTDPWLWDLGPRIYATYGLLIRRKN